MCIVLRLRCCSLASGSYTIPLDHDGFEDEVSWMLNGEERTFDGELHEFEFLFSS